MRTFTPEALGPFSLAARFRAGFTPAGYLGAADQLLVLALPAEGTAR